MPNFYKFYAFIFRSQSIGVINEKPEVTLDRLQLIAVALTPHHHKVRWLSFWNSSTHTREALHFPAKGFKTEELETWLNKASFWAGV